MPARKSLLRASSQSREASPAKLRASTTRSTAPDAEVGKAAEIARSYNISHMTISRLSGVTFVIGKEKL